MSVLKEQPSIRDLFAANIAGVLLAKADIKISPDDSFTREINLHDDFKLRTVAFLAYKLADKLLEERTKKD